MWMGNRFYDNRTTLALIAACLIASLWAVRHAPAAEQPQKQQQQAAAAEDQVAVSREQLRAIEQEIESLKREAARLGQQENSVIAMLDRFDVQMRLKTHEIELLGLRQRQTEQDIQSLSTSFQQLEKRMVEQRAYLDRRLVEAYKLGELNYWKLLLEVRTAPDLLRTYQYITFLARDDRRRLEEYRKSIRDMGEAKVRLQQENRTLGLLRADLESAHLELARDIEDKRRLLASIQNEKEMHLNTLSELRSAATQLQSLFINKEFGPSPVVSEGVGSMAKSRGTLEWPVHGKVVRPFGIEKNPRFGTTTVCNGVEIRAQEGAGIYAVYDGQVVLSEWFKGYGKSVIISHPGDFYTLYAHNSELLVARGDPVKKGQLIARAGSTGSLTGSGLYFELRDKDQPVDPLLWLRRPIAKR